MARPKILDMFDPSLSTGETAYTRLSSYADATISGDTMTVQVPNLTVQEGATLIINVITSSLNKISYITIGSRKFTLKDSAGVTVSQTFPLNSRLAISFDNTKLLAYLLNQAIPEGIILSDDEELNDAVTINADTLNGYSAEAFAMRSNTYNVFGTAEVIS